MRLVARCHGYAISAIDEASLFGDEMGELMLLYIQHHTHQLTFSLYIVWGLHYR
jgi:hypothetical protein